MRKRIKTPHGTVAVNSNVRIHIPERYEETSGRVSFHCEIEVPEGFDTGSLHKARVERVYSSDADKALEAFAKEKTIAEHHVNPAEGDIPQEDSYIFSDGSILSTDNDSSFVTKNSQHYSGAFWRISQEGEEDSQEKFDFAEPDECEGKIGKVLPIASTWQFSAWQQQCFSHWNTVCAIVFWTLI